MRTEITKKYNWGFLLSEQELRRVVQTCQDQLLKELNPSDCYIKLEAKLVDGSIIETVKVDDIIGLENVGSKQVEQLSIQCGDGKDKPDWNISVSFQDGFKNPRTWTAINFAVLGQSRDWAFLTASDIEERIRRVKMIPSYYIMGGRAFIFLPMLLSLAVLLFSLQFFIPENVALQKLEEAYQNGQLKDPIQALIFYEKEKSSNSNPPGFLLPLFASFLPIFLWIVTGRAIASLFPSYNFYWGDYMPRYDRLKNIRSVIWTVIILGIIVSIVASYLTRLLP